MSGGAPEPPAAPGPEGRSGAPERVALGRVVGAHGLRGELRVRYFGDDPENLLAVPEVELEAPGRAETHAGDPHERGGPPDPATSDERKRPSEPEGPEAGRGSAEARGMPGLRDERREQHEQDERFEVRAARPGRPGEVRLALAGVEDRDGAEALRGRRVTADPEALRPLPDGELYWYQLIGCRVEAASGRAVGTVRELMETGAHDVLVVEGEDGRTRLVPTARALMKEVDLERRRIVVEELPGLLDPA